MKNINLAVVSVLALITLAGCGTQATSSPTPSDQTTKSVPSALSKYSLAEIAKHSTKEDCWLLIHDQVYDVTKFIPNHPGRDAIVQGCGQDATNLFETRPMGTGTPHSDKARNFMTEYLIGDLLK